jgi:receptor expression-enhancing protein 5/6
MQEFIRHAHGTNKVCSGAQIVFRSFVQPVFSRYFSGAGATAANLRSKVDSAGDKTL